MPIIQSWGMGKDEYKFTLRLPRELMKQIRHEAADRELSLNSTMTEIISEWFEFRHVYPPTLEDKR